MDLLEKLMGISLVGKLAISQQTKPILRLIGVFQRDLEELLEFEP